VGCKGGFLAVVGFLGETLPIVIFIFDGFLFILKGAGCIERRLVD
jgi:hypothetical protein